MDGQCLQKITLTHPLAKVENLRPVFQPTLHAGYRL